MTCPECNGSGRVIVEDVVLGAQNYSRFAEPYHVEREIVCESCGGWGESQPRKEPRNKPRNELGNE